MFFPIYSPGGYLSHVTWTVYPNFSSPFLKMFHFNFGFDGVQRFQRKRFFNIVDNNGNDDEEGRQTTGIL